MDRRNLLKAALVSLGLPAAAAVAPRSPKDSFRMARGIVALNNAGTHPLHSRAAEAVREYLGYKESGDFPASYRLFQLAERPRAAFARLINASPREIAITQSTSMGENLIVAGLGIPGGRGNIVTDALHHEGSLYMYAALASRELEVRIARSRAWRIDIDELERLIDTDTRLVAISFVSWINGFEHDLKAVCELAHSRGALVYVDLIQGAGMVPIDVKTAGVDFCASATYKWLMGDCGVAFLYVRQDLQERMRRSQWGFMQMGKFRYHVFPYDEPGDSVMSYEVLDGARGRFEVGTPSFAAIAAAGASLDFILERGVESINAKVRPLIERLHEQMPRLGFSPMTPRDSRSAIAAFLTADPARVRAQLLKHRIEARLMGHQLRVSPAIHNDEEDLERLFHALASSTPD